MTKQRRPSNTVGRHVEAFIAAADGVPPIPNFLAAEMSGDDLIYWDAIVRGRAKAQWSVSELIVVAQLARCQAAIMRESRILEDEGSVVQNDKGNEVVNPRHTVIQALTARQLALMRSLRQGAAHGTTSGAALLESARTAKDQVTGEQDSLLA